MTHTDTQDFALRFEPLPASLAAHATRTFVDEDGGLPLRCCLRDSRPGERVALAGVTPDGPQGAYRETGPVFLHAAGCSGPAHQGYPEDFRRRTQVFRAYNHAGVIVGGAVAPPGSGQEEVAGRLLADTDVAFLQTRNVVFGCYMLTIRREPQETPTA
ncbi:DUF1203 domain-containing protein [Blastococcus haudaquaticus]|uniref:DUF1203 domain-containing protein n=1 Tax=Blastococcus haudaquaticus TaxID=1938745 RepID=A0A286GFF1_9ACTN|nr:DUF1203 domain-containing protein [Blastococcus haudaquaticus]SOD93956.1 Protein of unknown function [Blastococcus haudaquaticus]